MATIYLTLKLSAGLLLLLLPLGDLFKNKNGSSTEISDWAINEQGELINLAKDEPDHHPIK